MQIIKRQTLVSKLIVNLRLDGKRRVHKCGLKAKNETNVWTCQIKERSVGEVQRRPSCSKTCCLKCSRLKRSLCNCSLQCCGCTAAQQTVFQTKQLAVYFKCNLFRMFTKTKSRMLQNEQIAVHLHFYHMSHMKHISLCFYAALCFQYQEKFTISYLKGQFTKKFCHHLLILHLFQIFLILMNVGSQTVELALFFFPI